MNFSKKSKKIGSKRQRLFFVVFCMLVVINPLPLGSNRTWAWSFEAMIASSLLILMVICSLFSTECISWHRLKKMRTELSLIGAWFVINLLYLIPLPLGLLGFLSPTVASAYEAANQSFGYLSLDVYATYQILMLGLYYFSLFILGVILINSRKRIKVVLALFLALGVFEAVYGMYLVSIGQTGTLVQINSVDIGHASGTFINKNHLVAFLSMCLIMGIALRMILTRNYPDMSHLDFKIRLVRFIGQPIRLLDFSLFLLLAGIWSTHSRAGLASMTLTLVFLFLFVLFSKKMNVSESIKLISYKKILVGFAFVIILLIAVADDVNYFMDSLGQNTENSADHVMQSAQGRLLAVEQAIEHFPKYWFSGVGPGAYQVFFVNHRSVEQLYYFDHAHNDYVEFIVEYGLFSLLLLSMLLVFLYRIFVFIFKTKSRFYNSLGICVISCMIYMLLHGNMDFNARIPANVVTIIVVISMIYGRIVMSGVNNTKKFGR